MKSFLSLMSEVYLQEKNFALSDKFLGIPTTRLMAMAKDDRKYSPKQREEIKAELKARERRESVEDLDENMGTGAIAGAPANNTRSGPGMGDDSSLHMKKMRTWKQIYRRHKTPEEFLKKSG